VNRRDEIAACLTAVQERIAVACTSAGRDPAEITLVAVTKTYPAEDVLHLAALGVRDIGENRDQEAAAKAAAVRSAGGDVRWHFVGQLQRNKARSVAEYADLVHSVDRPQLVKALADGVRLAGRPSLDVLVQVNLDVDESLAEERGGAPASTVLSLADTVAATGVLRLCGLMAVAPLYAPPEPAFERLAGIAQALRVDHPTATIVSAGMSGDLEAAISYGATHVRVGSALLGKRALLG